MGVRFCFDCNVLCLAESRVEPTFEDTDVEAKEDEPLQAPVRYTTPADEESPLPASVCSEVRFLRTSQASCARLSSIMSQLRYVFLVVMPPAQL